MKPIRGGNLDTSKALAAIEKPKAARLQLNIHPDMHKAFKTACFHEEKEMSDLVLEFVYRWIEAKGGEVDPVWLMKPKDW
ncbi:TPA: plasmid partition protein ParG [Escherichia coli]